MLRRDSLTTLPPPRALRAGATLSLPVEVCMDVMDAGLTVGLFLLALVLALRPQ